MNIESFLQSDIPQRIYNYHESKQEDWRRPHLGASVIGEECERKIWYSFRWYKKPDFDGRMLRLFETGHLAEDRIFAELKAIGIKVHSQQKIVHIIAPFFMGSIDGIGEGFSESKVPHLLEVKTHNKKSWEELNSKGLQESKPKHYVQMQTYMGGLSLTRGYYLAINKDTDEIYAERVKFDCNIFIAIKNKAIRIVGSDIEPDRIEENPARFACRFCDYKSICHGTEAPEKNCRTCTHGSFFTEGFYCNYHKDLVPVDFQKEGCENYVEAIK